MSSPRPDVAPPRPWSFPVPDEHLLGNGVRVLVHDLPGQYVLSLRVVVPTALSAEPQGKEGVAAMTAAPVRTASVASADMVQAGSPKKSTKTPMFRVAF